MWIAGWLFSIERIIAVPPREGPTTNSGLEWDSVNGGLSAGLRPGWPRYARSGAGPPARIPHRLTGRGRGAARLRRSGEAADLAAQQRLQRRRGAVAERAEPLPRGERDDGRQQEEQDVAARLRTAGEPGPGQPQHADQRHVQEVGLEDPPLERHEHPGRPGLGERRARRERQDDQQPPAQQVLELPERSGLRGHAAQEHEAGGEAERRGRRPRRAQPRRQRLRPRRPGRAGRHEEEDRRPEHHGRRQVEDRHDGERAEHRQGERREQRPEQPDEDRRDEQVAQEEQRQVGGRPGQPGQERERVALRPQQGDLPGLAERQRLADPQQAEDQAPAQHRQDQRPEAAADEIEERLVGRGPDQEVAADEAQRGDARPAEEVAPDRAEPGEIAGRDQRRLADAGVHVHAHHEEDAEDAADPDLRALRRPDPRHSPPHPTCGPLRSSKAGSARAGKDDARGWLTGPRGRRRRRGFDPGAACGVYEVIWFFGSYQAFHAAAAGPIFG
jgi:hypothetical protein